MTHIETNRLILRDWKQQALIPFAEMNRDPQVMRYFLKPLNNQESLEYFNRIKEELTQYGYGLYLVEKKDDGAFIGFVHHGSKNTLSRRIILPTVRKTSASSIET